MCKPLSVAAVLFDGFELLDVFGPLGGTLGTVAGFSLAKLEWLKSIRTI